MDYLPHHHGSQFLQDSIPLMLTLFSKVLPDIGDYLGIQSCQTPPELLDLLERRLAGQSEVRVVQGEGGHGKVVRQGIGRDDLIFFFFLPFS